MAGDYKRNCINQLFYITKNWTFFLFHKLKDKLKNGFVYPAILSCLASIFTHNNFLYSNF